MPEGPEVKIISEWMKSKICGKYLMNIFCDIHSKYRPKGIPGIKLINTSYPLQIIDVFCRGKQIFLCLQDDNNKYYINSTLGMEGHWILGRNDPNNIKSNSNHSNLWLKIGDKLYKNEYDNLIFETVLELYFNDSRHFGNFRILTENQHKNKITKDVGQDLLNDNINWEDYYPKIKQIMSRTKKLNISEFLLKQSY